LFTANLPACQCDKILFFSTRSSGRASNFRTNFIRSFVSDSAESIRYQIEEQVLSEDADVDLVKLAQFAVKYQLPNSLRVSIWKLLLDVDSCYSKIKKVVAQHRKEEADVLLRSLTVMRALTNFSALATDETAEPDLESIDILRMIQLGDGKALVRSAYPNDIAKQMLIACKQEWRDAFWLTKNFDELVASVFTDTVLHKTAWETKDKLQAIKNDPAVTAINDNNLWSRIPFIFWFRSVGATMFSHEGVLKFWDKVCGCTKEGLVKLMKVTVEAYILDAASLIVETLKNDGQDITEFQLPKEAEVALLGRIFESFISSGRFPVRR
uniref:Rab-GAP TBC domain-containing protein n=1 Tax=Enterobius vermicularis TaxID=51028 RepID=A0A0N4VF16_ENTVE